jgi:hypothetical protein
LRASFPIALLFAAASASAALAASAPAAGPIVKDGLEITVLPQLAQASGSNGVFNVGLDMEARTDDAAHRLGFRSLHGVTAIDCRQGANRFVEAEAYPEAGMMGQGTTRAVSGKWVRPADDSYMAQVMARVCTSGGPATAPAAPNSAPSGPLPVVTNANLAEPAPPPAPSPVRPTRTAAAPTTHVLAPSPAAPAQAAARPGVKAVAQVAASSSAKDAQHVLNELHAMITPPLTTSVEPAVVQNAHIFRASVAGFTSMEAAKAFCARAASVSKTCWVHR